MDIGTINSALQSGLNGASRAFTQPSDAPEARSAEPSAAVLPKEAKEPSRDELESAAARIQDAVQSVKRNVNFSVEEDAGRVVVKVTDATSGDVIRQMPSEEALQLAENLEQVRNLLFKAEA